MARRISRVRRKQTLYSGGADALKKNGQSMLFLIARKPAVEGCALSGMERLNGGDTACVDAARDCHAGLGGQFCQMAERFAIVLDRHSEILDVGPAGFALRHFGGVSSSIHSGDGSHEIAIGPTDRRGRSSGANQQRHRSAGQHHTP
jgi:hypothetical protein